MNLHIIMHESFESPAAIEIWAKQNNHPVHYTRLYNHEQLPKNSDQFDMLIIMGGPQSPATTTTECPYFNAQQEIAFIQAAIAANKLVLGVCLGAQLIGAALGAQYERSPHREIGVFNVTLTDDGKQDEIFSAFPSTFAVAHWHNDMPGITKEAKILAFSDGCPRQVIRYTPKVYGFQCHFEMTLDAIENMLAHVGGDIKNKNNLPFIQTAEQLRQNNYDSFNKLLFQFLDQFSKRK